MRPPGESPIDEYEREIAERGAAVLGWLRRLLVCWLIFQAVTAANVLTLWSEGLLGSVAPREIAMSPGALLLALFAGWAGMTAIRNRPVLPQRWFVAGLVPWGLLVAQGTVLLVAMRR